MEINDGGRYTSAIYEKGSITRGQLGHKPKRRRKTLPTVGPLFGSFKFQADIFICPMRLYNAQLHMNKIGVGMDIKKVKFPLIRVMSLEPNNTDKNGKQLSQSSLLAYLGIRSSGQKFSSNSNSQLTPNAMPYLAYFDIFKNYYANKQEKNAYIIDNDASTTIIDRIS